MGLLHLEETRMPAEAVVVVALVVAAFAAFMIVLAWSQWTSRRGNP